MNLPKTYPSVRWLDDLDPSGADTATDLESLEQDVQHIILQRRGSNLADPTKGAGAEDYVNGTLTQLRALPAVIDSELAAVTRITGSQTTLSQQPDSSWLISVVVNVGAQVLNLQFAVGPTGLTRVP